MRRFGLLAFVVVALFGLLGSQVRAQQVNSLVSGLLDLPGAIAYDPSGNLYVVNGGNSTIVKVEPNGAASVFASGVNVAATALAIDKAGNLYVVDTTAGAVDRIAPDGTVSVYASVIPGLSLPLQALAFDGAGDLYVGDQYGNITLVSPTGTDTTILTASGPISNIFALTVDSSGILYISCAIQTGPSASAAGIARLSPGGSPTIFTLSDIYQALAIDSQGNVYGSRPFFGGIDEFAPDGTNIASLAPKEIVTGLAFDSSGALVFADQATSYAIDRLGEGGAVSQVVGSPLPYPLAVVANPAGGLYVLDETGGVSKVDVRGAVTPFVSGFTGGAYMAIDHQGNLYVSDASQTSRITPDGTITRGIATHYGPLAVDAQDNLYIAALGDDIDKVFQVTPSGTSSQYTQINAAGPVQPIGLAIDAKGNADVLTAYYQDRNLEVQAGIWQLSPGTQGDGSFSSINFSPNAIALDATGNIFYANGNGISELPDGNLLGFPVTVTTAPLAQYLWALTFDSVGNLYGAAIYQDAIVQVILKPSPLASAVLPGARSVQVRSTATVFATLLNSSDTALGNCAIALPASAPGGLSMQYQTTDPSTNALTGTPGQPASIPANGSQSFALSFTSTTPLTVPDLPLFFDCDGVTAAPVVIGVGTVDLLFSAKPVADIIALAATATGDGTVVVPGSSGTGAFAVATIDAGAADTITVSADTGTAALPIASILLCQTNAQTGACLAPPAPTLQLAYAPEATPTLSAFVTASGSVPFDPAGSRIFLRFRDAAGALHGATSVAVKTM